MPFASTFMRKLVLSIVLVGSVVVGQSACQEPGSEKPTRRDDLETVESRSTLKTARVASDRCRLAYFEMLCEFLATKREAPDGFDHTTIAIINGWHSDVTYKSVHAILGELVPTRAIGLELSAADNKGLEALWLAETSDKEVWLVAARDGVLVSSRCTEEVGLTALIKKVETICPRSQVNVATVFDGTVHGIIVLDDGKERVRISHSLPDDITPIWNEIYEALLKEDGRVRQKLAGDERSTRK